MTRRLTCGALLVIGSLLASLWGGLFWAQRNVYRSDEAVALLTKQLDRPSVRRALTDQIVLLLPASSRRGTGAGAVPGVATGVATGVADAVATSLDSAEFRDTFVAAARRADQFVLDATAGPLVLDLSPHLPTLIRVIGRVEPEIAASIPPDLTLVIIIADQRDLPGWLGVVRRLPDVAVGVGAAGLIALLAGLILARRRLLAGGVAVAGVALFSGIGAALALGAPTRIASIIGGDYDVAIRTVATDVAHGLVVQLTATAAAAGIIAAGLLAGAAILRRA